MSGRAPILPPDFRLIALDEIGSTNDEARRLAAQGAAAFTLVWAREQTKGRGRQGRDWASPPGNLYCSLVLRPAVALARAPELSFVAALALGEAVRGFLPPSVDLRLKWPNDVLLDERKVSGILLESGLKPDGTLDFLVLGTGVNVASHPAEGRMKPTSLAAMGARAGVEDMLETYARAIEAWYRRWLAEGFDAIRAAWLERAWRLGQRLEMNAGEGRLAGRFDGLGPDGALLLTLDDGTRRSLAAGDVAAARAA